MKRALLIGVSGGGIDASLAEERLHPALEKLGFDDIHACSDARATRAGMLAAIDRLLDVSTWGDAVFIHYFGHGGRVCFTDLAPEQVFGYLTCTKPTREFEVVLDIELSRRLAQLDRRCGNVTVMLDCCHSGEVVRERDPSASPSAPRRIAAPPWAHAAVPGRAVGLALGLHPQSPLALGLHPQSPLASEADLEIDSHPGIVRLCGASPKREAFAATRAGRHIGRMTEAFLAALDEVGDAWPQLTWQTLGHRVREHVIEALEMEGQWVALAGPRARRLFARELVQLPGSVTFVPGDEPGRGHLRVGWLQGVAVGDRFGVLDPRVDATATTMREVEVVEVQRNRAEVRYEPIELRAGMPAILSRAATPLRVASDDPSVLVSPWLAAAHDDAEAELRREGELLVISLRDASRGPARFASDRLAQATELLEHHARARALLRSLAGQRAHENPLSVRVHVLDHEHEPSALEQGHTLPSGSRVVIELRLADDDVFHWFVHMLLIDPIGRLRLLNPRAPEGLELAPGDVERIGYRFARRGAQGLTLRWPDAAAGEVGPASLLMLASRRPIELGHLVELDPLDDDLALDLRELSGDSKRERKPEHTRACTWTRLDFTLSKSPRRAAEP